jgi:hypothetical protein
MADAITVRNNLRLAPRRPTGRFAVLKVPNRTLLLFWRQAMLGSCQCQRKRSHFDCSFSSRERGNLDPASICTLLFEPRFSLRTGFNR